MINQGAVTGAVGGSGLHVNAYLGDVNGDTIVTALDTLTADMVAQGRATGFSAFGQLDPVIIGDVAGDISFDAGDVSSIDSFVVQLHPIQIPNPPTQLPANNSDYLNPNSIHSPNAADPTLSLGHETHGLPSVGLPIISVMVDHPHPAGSTGLTEAIVALTYDPAALSITPKDITLGSIPSQGTGWQLSAVVNQTTGQIGIQLYSLTPITATQAGSLVNIAFHVLGGEPTGASQRVMPATTVQLVNAVMPNGRSFSTVLADSQGALILSPGVDRIMLETAAPEVNSWPGVRYSEALVNVEGHTRRGSQVEEESGASQYLSPGHGFVGVEIAEFRNRNVDEETIDAVAVRVAVSSNLAFQASGQEPNPDLRVRQAFQIGLRPVLNALLFLNSPGQQATEWLFLALAWNDGASNDILEPQVTEQQTEGGIGDSRLAHAVNDEIFAQMADDRDEFGDLGD